MIKQIKNSIKKFVNTLPYVKVLYQQSLNSCFPNGHFYSPVISIEDIKVRENEIWKNSNNDGILGIKLNKDIQVKFAKDFEVFYSQMPFQEEKQKGLRYHLNNSSYSYTDGIVLYSMIRKLEPKRIIEIGSGNSSTVMMDTNELFFDSKINLTFIDPYPEKLISLMNDNDLKINTIIKSDAQLISLDVFEKLESGDILFIDSTHVSKTGSDVNYILFDIIPILKKGVYIHFHDIFYPFEYPKKWVYEGRNWNENYILKAFLMYNNNFEITFFSDYLNLHSKDSFSKMPMCSKNSGGNLWLKKIN